MAPVEDLEELFRGNPGVEGGGLEPLVSEELLDVTDVGAVAKKMSRARMAKEVRMDAGDRYRGGVLFHEDGEGHVGDALRSFSISAKEERSFSGIPEKLRANLSKVEIEGGGGLAGQGNDAVSFSFGVPNEKPALLEVDVGDVEPHTLTSPDSRSVENLEKRAVTPPSPGARGGRFHQARCFPLGENASREARESGRAKLHCGTPKENAPLDEAAKKLTNALEIDGLGRQTQRRKGACKRDEMSLLNGTRLTDALFSKTSKKPREGQDEVTLGGGRRMAGAKLLEKSESVPFELGLRPFTGREGAHGEPPFEGPRSRPGYSARSSEGSGDREVPGCDGCPPDPGGDGSPCCGGERGR